MSIEKHLAELTAAVTALTETVKAQTDLIQTGTARDIVRHPASPYVAEFVAHMDPLAVLTAADLSEPGEAPGTPLPPDLSAREVMAALAVAEALPVAGGGRVTRAGVLQRLANPRNGSG